MEFVFGLLLGVVLVGVCEVYRERRWQRRTAQLQAQLDVFTDASVAVADAVQSLLARPATDDAEPATTLSRQQRFKLARQRLRRADGAVDVQQGLGLHSAEMALLIHAQASSAATPAAPAAAGRTQSVG